MILRADDRAAFELRDGEGRVVVIIPFGPEFRGDSVPKSYAERDEAADLAKRLDKYLNLPTYG